MQIARYIESLRKEMNFDDEAVSYTHLVFWLLDFAGYRRIESTGKQPLVHQVTKKQQEERKPFVLPQPAGDKMCIRDRDET